MKQILFSLLLVASGVITKAQTVDEIVAKHIEAVGGVDAWKKVNAIKMEGTVMVQGADVSVIVTSVNKKGARQDISLMGMNGFVIITPTAGWTYLPFQGQNEVDAMTEDDLKETVDELDIEGKLIGYKEKGTTIDYLGKEDVDGSECDKLAVTTKSGNKETYFIDPASSYIIKSIKFKKANGQEVEEATMYSNYTKLEEGIVIAKSMTLPFGELNFTKVEVNPVVDEGIFKPAK